MRIVHFADTHLGFSDFAKIDPELGINLREADVYRAFSQVVEYIRKNPPNIVIHSGDLFETSRPSNRAINFALKEIAKISQMAIPFILISGNHSTPRTRSSGSIFEAFEIFDGLHPVYKSKHERVSIQKVMFHCIPHMPTEEEINGAFEMLSPDTKFKYNVIVSHAGVTADIQYKMGEFNELMIPFSALTKKNNFDYIAMGHYHRHLELAPNAYYSGSTECFSFREANDEKGFMDVDLDNKTFKFIPIKVREMAIFEPIACIGLRVKEIEDAVEHLTRNKINDKIVQITFDKISRHQYVELDFQRLKEITGDAVYVKWASNWAVEKGKEMIQTSIGTLTTEFESFLDSQEIKDLDKGKLKRMGKNYLSITQEPEGP
jgi:exonuclease SbcD